VIAAGSQGHRLHVGRLAVVRTQDFANGSVLKIKLLVVGALCVATVIVHRLLSASN